MLCFRGCIPSPDLWKLEVVVCQEDAEAVLLYLGRIGVAQFINVNEEAERFDGLLEEYTLPCEVTVQHSDILRRINRVFEELDLKPEEQVHKTQLLSKASLKEIFDDIERRLSEIEKQSKPLGDTKNLGMNLERKIDQKLQTWKVNLKKIGVKRNTGFSEKPSQAVFEEAERKFSEIETRLNELNRTYAACSNMLSRIDRLEKTHHIKMKEPPVKEPPFPPDAKSLAFIELILSEVEKSLSTNVCNDLPVKELLTIKSTILRVIEQIPNARISFLHQASELRDHVKLLRQAIPTTPEVRRIHAELSDLHNMALKVDELLAVEKSMTRCASTIFLEAWVPQLHLKELKEGIRTITKGKCIIEEELPNTEDQAPTVIKPVPRFMEAFEKLTFSLGYPRSKEINPVWLMAFTFPLLFGIMFADVGQGAILVMAGLVLTYFRGKANINKVGEITRYFLVASGLIVLCGIASIAFGFLFGDFFGPSGVLHPVMLTTIGPFKIGGFDPMHEPLTLLRFALLVGITLLSLGLVLKVMNNIREKRPKFAFISTCWLWLLLGGFFMWIHWGGISNLTRWFSEGSFMFFGLVGLPTLLIGVVTASSRGLMEGIDFSIEVLLESLDHTISFSRLAALFLTHAALNHMFLILAGVKNGVFTLQSIPVIMVGTVLALSIEGLIIFVHTLRLHWIELLPEFYSGKGILFKPFKTN